MSRHIDFTAKWYDAKVTKIADGLRDLADRIEREGRPRDGAAFDGTPRYTNAAATALHELTWGLANLHTDQLVIAAGQADAAENTTEES